jgi:aspartate/methionine/tyrosine aminotransferase
MENRDTMLLEEAGVACTAGQNFGSHATERHLRFAYTTSLSQLEEGVRFISQFLIKQPR